ncbi:MAG: hypothetical protein RKU31_14340 [Deltaproteobacteria bacterium]|jgi:hypothetical protein
MKRMIFTMTTLVASLSTAAAFGATTGTVSGKLQFYQNQGNYCPTSRDCTNARYKQADFGTFQPIANALVYLFDVSNVAIGAGTTDADGDFTISWYSVSNANQASVRFFYEQDGQRFAIRSSDGSVRQAYTPDFSITNGTAPNNPQAVGTFSWGSSASPNEYMNVYDGAEKMWRKALKNSNAMLSYFNSLDVWVNSNDCSTSCADGSAMVVKLDPNAEFKPQARILHEMGHIASYLASNDQNYRFSGTYNFPVPNQQAGNWSLNTAEWGSVQFEEGVATFFGDAAFYGPGNPTPFTCNSTGVCNSFDTELSTGANNCVVNEDRQVISVVRFLRDAFDSTSDWAGDDVQRPLYDFIDTITVADNGRDEGEKNEPWSVSNANVLDDDDGRSAVDFRRHFKTRTGVSIWKMWNRNCQTVGD